jgi:acyl CoA:acetate/3-ketoacid CoA transferase alpha subunit
MSDRMMDTKTRRKYLIEHNDAARQIELSGAAIAILEMMNTRVATKAIQALKRDSQRHLKRLDSSAAKLGAPYGS